MVERLVKYKDKPLRRWRGAACEGLNHSSTTCWGGGSESGWTILSGHEPGHSKDFQTCREELDVGDGGDTQQPSLPDGVGSELPHWNTHSSNGAQQRSWGGSCYEADMVPGGT